MFKTLMGNNDQLWAQLTTLFAAGGPIAALLLQIGLPADQTSNFIKIVQALLVVIPLVIKIIHDRSANSDPALLKSAATVKGAEVSVDTTRGTEASPAVVAAALDTSNAIVPKVE